MPRSSGPDYFRGESSPARLTLGSYTRKRRVVSNRAGLPAESAWCQLQRHEYFVGHVVLATEPEARRWLEAEPRIVLRMTKHDNRTEADLPGRFKASAHETRAERLSTASRPGPSRGPPFDETASN